MSSWPQMKASREGEAACTSENEGSLPERDISSISVQRKPFRLSSLESTPQLQRVAWPSGRPFLDDFLWFSFSCHRCCFRNFLIPIQWEPLLPLLSWLRLPESGCHRDGSRYPGLAGWFSLEGPTAHAALARRSSLPSGGFQPLDFHSALQQEVLVAFPILQTSGSTDSGTRQGCRTGLGSCIQGLSSPLPPCAASPLPCPGSRHSLILLIPLNILLFSVVPGSGP